MGIAISMVVLFGVFIYTYILAVSAYKKAKYLEEQIGSLQEIQELLSDSRRLVNELTWEKLKDKNGAVNEEMGR